MVGQFAIGTHTHTQLAHTQQYWLRGTTGVAHRPNRASTERAATPSDDASTAHTGVTGRPGQLVPPPSPSRTPGRESFLQEAQLLLHVLRLRYCVLIML